MASLKEEILYNNGTRSIEIYSDCYRLLGVTEQKAVEERIDKLIDRGSELFRLSVNHMGLLGLGIVDAEQCTTSYNGLLGSEEAASSSSSPSIGPPGDDAFSIAAEASRELEVLMKRMIDFENGRSEAPDADQPSSSFGSPEPEAGSRLKFPGRPTMTIDIGQVLFRKIDAARGDLEIPDLIEVVQSYVRSIEVMDYLKDRTSAPGETGTCDAECSLGLTGQVQCSRNTRQIDQRIAIAGSMDMADRAYRRSEAEISASPGPVSAGAARFAGPGALAFDRSEGVEYEVSSDNAECEIDEIDYAHASRTMWAFGILFFGLGDVVTTYWSLFVGNMEMNPITRFLLNIDPVTFITFKIMIICGLYIIYHYSRERESSSSSVLAIPAAMAFIGAFVTFNNLIMIFGGGA